jgi:hypothetical protein
LDGALWHYLARGRRMEICRVVSVAEIELWLVMRKRKRGSLCFFARATCPWYAERRCLGSWRGVPRETRASRPCHLEIGLLQQTGRLPLLPFCCDA